ncbi:MAG: sulfate ABC transporter substrate-binding protein [Planctomycetes bacterium]|nr:sulfate ABC transporter substrate-binding protein [Planctomycetota bacterium]
MRRLALLTLLAAALAAGEILNASYDVARDVYRDLNAAFAKTAAGQGIVVRQSHDGAAKQARAVIEGLPADVVTMNSSHDIDQIARAGLIAADWRKRLPNNASPSYSLHVFVVRSGNPKQIRDWGDLLKPGVQIIAVNPKTGTNGKYTYLGLHAWASRQPGANDDSVRAALAAFYRNVLTLEKGGRAATTAFAQRELGDVLVTFESEALRIQQEFAGKVEIVWPSLSVRADNPVAWVDANVAKKNTLAAARAYLEFLYTKEAQEIFARHYMRPSDPQVLAAQAGRFAAVETVTVEEAFGSWEAAQKQHFDDGGWFDQLYGPR